MGFGPGECFGIYFSIVCALRASVVRQGFALETPSPPDFWLPLRLVDPKVGKMIAWLLKVLSVLLLPIFLCSALSHARCTGQVGAARRGKAAVVEW